jgi:hypothetical protein
MRITIPLIDGDESIIVTDESSDNDNYIDLLLGEKEYTVGIDELISALLAFEEVKKKTGKREILF